MADPISPTDEACTKMAGFKFSTPPSSTNNPFIFPSGDVILKATYHNAPILGKVSSSALSLASPVWSKFIFQPWAPPNSPPTESIDCSDDDGEALLLLMKIAHLKFGKIPRRVEFPLLLQLAILCDKYDCVRLVKPWLESWLEDEKSVPSKFDEEERKLDLVSEPEPVPDTDGNVEQPEIREGEETQGSLQPQEREPATGLEGWLFITWTFGREETFEYISNIILQNLQIDKNGLPAVFNATLQEPLPLGLIENMLKIREISLNKFLDIPFTRLSHIESEIPEEELSGNNKTHNKDACNAITYGSLILSLKRAGYYPRPPIKDIKRSIVDMSWYIESLYIHALPQKGKFGSITNHQPCGFPNLGELVSDILVELPCPIMDSHRAHMEAAREKCELDS